MDLSQQQKRIIIELIKDKFYINKENIQYCENYINDGFLMEETKEERKRNIESNKELINKPNSRQEAFSILKKLNNSIHYLISSACITKNGSMIWNHTDSSELKMKNLNDDELLSYLNKIDTKTLLAYGVYQIEANGLELFEYIKGDKDSIMGLPIKQIINYIKQLKK